MAVVKRIERALKIALMFIPAVTTSGDGVGQASYTAMHVPIEHAMV